MATEPDNWKQIAMIEAWNRQYPLENPSVIDHADESRPE